MLKKWEENKRNYYENERGDLDVVEEVAVQRNLNHSTIIYYICNIIHCIYLFLLLCDWYDRLSSSFTNVNEINIVIFTTNYLLITWNNKCSNHVLINSIIKWNLSIKHEKVLLCNTSYLVTKRCSCKNKEFVLRVFLVYISTNMETSNRATTRVITVWRERFKEVNYSNTQIRILDVTKPSIRQVGVVPI